MNVKLFSKKVRLNFTVRLFFTYICFWLISQFLQFKKTIPYNPHLQGLKIIYPLQNLLPMIRSAPATGNGHLIPGIVLLCLLGASVWYFTQQPVLYLPPLTAQATSPDMAYEVTASDITIDWATGGGDFDPRDKCPPDFFRNGFVLVCKKLGNGAYAKFLYHKGKKLLYRIDKDVFMGKTRIGLHWVESTKFNSRYRIADPAYKGGKMLKVPNAKGGRDTKSFHYGQAVSKKKGAISPGAFPGDTYLARPVPGMVGYF